MVVPRWAKRQGMVFARFISANLEINYAKYSISRGWCRYDKTAKPSFSQAII